MKHDDAMASLKNAQTANRDLRDNAREAHDFVNKRDGQWESEIVHRFKGKPKYTDDRVNPIVNQIVGSLTGSEFAVRVRPAGGDATQDISKVYDGLVRTIRNISKETQVTAQVCRNVVESGIDGYLIEHDYVKDTSFDQDLIIKPIHDFADRCWLDPFDLTRDGSKSRVGFLLEYMDEDEAKKQFNVRTISSISSNSHLNRYWYKASGQIVVGRFFYLKEEKITLHQMSDGSVYEDDDKFQKSVIALEDEGITIEKTREKKVDKCYIRYADANDWLDDEQPTVFQCIPIVPAYGNFKVVEGKIVYRGAVEKLMDIQRVHNYAFSRDVEEVALAPRKKYWMTRDQAAGEEESLSTLNTNMEPVQFYNHVPNTNPPAFMGGGEVNGAIRTLVDSTDQSINRAAGLFGANMGNVEHLQSGTAIEKQINRGDNGINVYFEAVEVAVARLGEILVHHIPLVYDATRQLRILKEDNSYELIVINQIVPSEDGQDNVTLNDLTVGQYDVTCDIGASYKNRQEQASEMFLRAFEKNPELMMSGMDIWAKNIAAPSFDILAERLRAQALKNGLIPEEQLTEDEAAFVKQQQEAPKEPNIEELVLQVQQMEAQTAQMAEQNKSVEHQIKMQELQAKFAQEKDKTDSKMAVDSAKIDQQQQKIDLASQQQQFVQATQQMKNHMDMMKAQSAELTANAQALRNIKDAMGVDAIVSPTAIEAFENTAEEISEGGMHERKESPNVAMPHNPKDQ